MGLDTGDRGLPVPREVGQKSGLLAGVRKLLGNRQAPAGSSTVVEKNNGLVKWQEGEVPLTEVARIIKEQGDTLARNLYAQYGGSFDGEFDPENRIEDKENNVQIFRDGRDHRRVKVFIVPPGTTEIGYALELKPNVMFFYKRNDQGQWEYDGATIHDGGGYVDANSSTATEEWDKRHGGHFWNARVKMKDMERALGQYLNPVLPTADQGTPVKQIPPAKVVV